MGLGYEIFLWANKRGLELPVLFSMLVLLIVVLFLLTRYQVDNSEKPYESLCDKCHYKCSENGTRIMITCSEYKPMHLFKRRQSECPVESAKRINLKNVK